MSFSPPSATMNVAETPFGKVVTLEGPHGRAVVHEHGAHVTSYVPAGGAEVLFLSREARIDGRSAIRGGVPVIFPQFGPGPITRHGFARTARWTLGDRGVDDDGAPWVQLTLADDAATRATWPHAFALALVVRVGPALSMRLDVRNTGDSAFAFTGALHTYLRVRDVTRASVRGLEGRRVRDQLAKGAERVEGDEPVRVTQAVDRVYLDVPGPLEVRDDAARRTVRVSSAGFDDVVVWNPWTEGARAFDDMADDEWREMLCVEAAAVARPVTVAPHASWTGEQRLDVVRS